MLPKKTNTIIIASIVFVTAWLIVAIRVFANPHQGDANPALNPSSEAGQVSSSENSSSDNGGPTTKEPYSSTPTSPNSISTESDSADSSTRNEPAATEPTTESSNFSSGPSCLHYESGRCWDDMEMEAYYYGIYDHQFGYYGASLYYDDTCDAICQDILDDAYDEGWYDQY